MSMKKIIFGVLVVLALSAGVFVLFSTERSTVVETVTRKLAYTPSVLPELTLSPHTLTFSDGTSATFRLPEGFSISTAAEDLGKARFMAWSPDGRLFVPDLVDYNLSHEGRLFILEDFDEETGQFNTKHTYLTGLRGPNSVAFYTDENGQHWLYLALTAHLLRYPYTEGDTEPSGEPEVVVEFPNQQSPGEVSVVWHITRTIMFHDDRLYVSVGSGCNSCEQLSGSMRAMIYSMNPDGTDQRVEGEGLRNTVGIEMAEGELYATANGVDHLGTDRPDEMMYKVEDGNHYGWPYCYVLDGENVADMSQVWETPLECSEVPLPVTTFDPRSAPLGLTYFADAHPALAGSFLVALHGSFEQWIGSGYELIRVSTEGEQELFMDGFLDEEGNRTARAVDILQHDEDSFFVTDDHGGRIFYISAND